MSLSATNLSESGFYDFSFNLLHLKEADEKKVNEEEKKGMERPHNNEDSQYHTDL